MSLLRKLVLASLFVALPPLAHAAEGSRDGAGSPSDTVPGPASSNAGAEGLSNAGAEGTGGTPGGPAASIDAARVKPAADAAQREPSSRK